MTPAATTLDPTSVAVLAHENDLEYARELTRWAGRAGEQVEADGLLLVASATTFPVVFNLAARLDPELPAAEALDRADAWFAERERGYTLSTRDTGDGLDDDLRTEAEARGLTDLFGSPAMVCHPPLDPIVLPDDVELRWIDDRAGFDDFLGVNASAYVSLGMPEEIAREALVDHERMLMPHIHSVVAYVEGEPAAAAQVLFSHGIAGVYWVGTAERARGRGLGELVTRAVTRRGFELGAPFVTLQASPMGDPIYRRMGYQEIYRYRSHVRFSVANHDDGLPPK